MAIKLTPEEKTRLMQVKREMAISLARHGADRDAILRNIGIQPNTYEAAFTRGSIKLSWLFRMLGELEIPLGGFFAKALGFQGRSAPYGTPPKGVRVLQEREASGDLSAKGTETLTIEDIRELDMVRQDNPRQVNQTLESTLHTAAEHVIPEILLVYGGTFRQLGKLEDARWSYYEGERFSERHGNVALCAQFQQRRSWVEFLDGKMQFALDLLRGACGTFCELGLSDMEGCALTDIAMQYYDRGMIADCARSATQALSRLENSNFRFRFCAYQAMAMSNKEMGKIEESIYYSNLVKETSQLCPVSWQIRAIWMDAEIKREAIDELEMAGLLRSAADFFLEIGEVLDGIIAILQQTLIQLNLGNWEEVERNAQRFKEIAFQAEGGLATGVCMELYRASLVSRLNQSRVTMALRKLEDGRAVARPDRPSHWG